MKHQNYHWKSHDGLNIFAQSWLPDESPKAVVNFCHGLGDHSSRHNEWAANFVNNGYAFSALDLRGHGMSEGKRGHARNYECFLKDFDLLVQNSKKLFPNKKMILYGHSMGGAIAINYTLSGKSKSDGLIVTSPWLKLAFDPSRLKQLTGRALKPILPGLLQPTGLHGEHITRSQEKVEKYLEDPLIHNKISLKIFFDACFAGIRALNKANDINVPVLLMHGSGDKITAHKASVEFAGKNTEKVTLKIYDGCFHELHNEPEKDQVWRDILEWLEVSVSVKGEERRW